MPKSHEREKTTDAYYTSLDELSAASYEENMSHFFGVGAHCGSTDLNMHVAYLPPGAESRAHFHLRSDASVFVLEGECKYSTWNQEYERTEKVIKAGDFVFVPRGTIHKAVNHTNERFGLVACYNNAGTGAETLKIYVEDPVT